MKRVCATILAILYLYSTAGATIYHHYCMGALISTSLLGHHGRKCEKCGMQKHSVKKEKDCCKDVQSSVKSGDQHITPQLCYDIPTPSIIAASHFLNLFHSNITGSHLHTAIFLHSPPTAIGRPVFLQLQNLRI